MAEIITIGETMAVIVPNGKGRLSEVDGFGLHGRLPDMKGCEEGKNEG